MGDSDRHSSAVSFFFFVKTTKYRNGTIERNISGYKLLPFCSNRTGSLQGIISASDNVIHQYLLFGFFEG